MADEAVNKIRAGDAGVATLKLNEADEIELVDFTEAGETVGAVASALGADQLCFVYGAVLLDETKGGLDVASDSLARRKLVLVTSVGSDLPPRDRGAVSEKRLKLRAKLPDLVAHVEIQVNTASEAEHAQIVEKVKTSSGAFYDSGAGGADQTVEACASAVGSATIADPANKAKPPSSARGGGRRLVKRTGGGGGGTAAATAESGAEGGA